MKGLNYGIMFVFESILLGVGLAMDAFSVSMANGLQNPGMSRRRMLCIAGTFAGFQFLMPMIGWACVRLVAERFVAFQKMVPWIAFVLLGFIGGKMLLEGLRGGSEELEEELRLTGAELLVQGIATSIDALSVGFTIADYGAAKALAAALLIAVTTLLICIAGLRIGRYFGMRIAGKASILGGVILIAIGCRILMMHLIH
ncbi:MAG: manganese efflux pump [Eubacteriales bacterium]|nr:manganese efflux pump [Eubacteriales bacterium]